MRYIICNAHVLMGTKSKYTDKNIVICIDKNGQYFGELAIMISEKNIERYSLLCLPYPTVLTPIFRSLPPESLSVSVPFLVTDTKG